MGEHVVEDGSGPGGSQEPTVGRDGREARHHKRRLL